MSLSEMKISIQNTDPSRVCGGIFQKVTFMIVSIRCNVQIFMEFRKENMEKKLFFGYRCISIR